MMKLAIQCLIALTFAIVIACGFQEKPALAEPPCRVTSTNPCVLNLENTQFVNVAIGVNQNLLVVYTNNSFGNPVSVNLIAGGQIQDTKSLYANQSVFTNYPIRSYNGIQFQAFSTVEKPNATVVVVQANSQQSK